MRIQRFPDQQQGVVLITVILIVAIISMTALAMATRQQVDVRRSANILDREQAYRFALGAETWAMQILARDQQDNKTDHLAEDWAVLPPPFAVEGGVLSADLEDLQGRFNINNLVVQAEQENKAIRHFQRLLANLELDESLAYAVRDWLDADEDLTLPGGAEDGEYLSLATPYRAANHTLADTSELMAVQGVTAAVYNKLAPHVVALPGPTAVNVNTASAVVLSAVIEGLSLSDAERVLEARESQPYATIDEFVKGDAMAGIELANNDRNSLTVNSHYFLLHSRAHFGRGQITLSSTLARNEEGRVQVLKRSQGVF